MLNGYTQDGHGGSFVDNVYQVAAVDGGGSLMLLRQPISDQVFTGNGARQSTNYLPVVNQTGADQYFYGSLIYVATDKGTLSTKQDEALDDSCIYILAVGGAIRKSYCRTDYPTLRNGIFLTAPERIAPGEAIVAQMAYTAPNGSAWGAVNALLLNFVTWRDWKLEVRLGRRQIAHGNIPTIPRDAAISLAVCPALLRKVRSAPAAKSNSMSLFTNSYGLAPL